MYEISSCRLVIKSLYLSIRRAQPALETSQTDLLGDREFPSWRALLPNNTNYQLIFIPQPPHYRAGQTRGVFTFLFVYQKDDPLSSACRGGECCIVPLIVPSPHSANMEHPGQVTRQSALGCLWRGGSSHEML